MTLRAEPAQRPRARRAALTTVLFIAMALGAYAAFAFGVLAPYLLVEFGITRSQLGLLTTVMFGVGATCSLPAGRLVDRFGGRAVLVGSLVVVLASTVVMAVAPSFPVLVAGAALAGCAVAAGNPTTNKLVGQHVPEGERGVVTGIKQAGVQAGAFVVGAALPVSARALGWRGALGAVALVAAASVWLAVRVLPGEELAEPGARRRFRDALSPLVRWMALYGFLMGVGVAAITAYLPLYARERVGISPEEAGAVAATLGGVGVAARVLWAGISERLGRYSLPLAFMALGAVVAIALVFLAPATGAWLLWGSALLLGGTAVTWNAVGMLTIITEVDEDEAGRAAGWVLMGFYGGFVVSPIAFGHSVDVTGDYLVGWGAVAGVFAAAALVALVCGRSGAPRPSTER